MNLLIVEWISGGGLSNQKLSSSILSEGYAMLRSVISDCKTAGHKVTTFLDSRLTGFNPPNKADNIFPISTCDEFYRKIAEFSSLVDGVFVIAPESGQVLENIVETVEKSGGISLNCRVNAIKQVSNKMSTYETLKKQGTQVPETVLIESAEKINNIKSLAKNLGYPVIFKPLEGVSCNGLSVVKTEEEIERALLKIAQESTKEQIIIQKQIIGKNVSACVFSDGTKAKAVTLNKQFVSLASPADESKYYGGIVPYNHPLEKKALKTAERAVEAVTGLRGYVGVDMVLTDMESTVIEINPRLTVSYVGLKKAVNFNPGQAIIEAVVEGKLPKKIQNTGYSFFSKIKVPATSSQPIAQIYNMKEVVSPPFPVQENEPNYALVAVDSTTNNGAKSAFYRAKKRLIDLYDGEV